MILTFYLKGAESVQQRADRPARSLADHLGCGRVGHRSAGCERREGTSGERAVQSADAGVNRIMMCFGIVDSVWETIANFKPI